MSLNLKTDDFVKRQAAVHENQLYLLSWQLFFGVLLMNLSDVL